MLQNFPVLILTVAILAGAIVSAGCSGSQIPDGNSAGIKPSPPGVPVSPVIVKNTAIQEIHAWVASDPASWGGSGENQILPGKQLALVPPSSGAFSVCIGKSEKVLKCIDGRHGSETLVWDGTDLIAQS